MGVDLKDIVKATKIPLESLAGRTLAIDAYNALYQFLAIIRGGSGEYLMDRHGRVTSHLSGLFYRNVNLVELGIKPIYIFDGQPPELKTIEIERRRAVKHEAALKYSEAVKRGDLAEARKYAQATSVLKDYMVDDAKRMLDLLGIPWIDAPSEGEATAAYLTTIGLATDAASQDFDSILFGAKRLVRNVTISGRRRLPSKNIYIEVEPEEVELNNLLRQLGITREQLVDIGILVGTDYNPDGFRRIGPSTALKLIKTHGRLEAVPGIQDELRRIDYQAIREIFLKPKVTAPVEKPVWRRPDFERILDFLCGERAFSEERVKKALQRLERVGAEKTESLEKWF